MFNERAHINFNNDTYLIPEYGYVPKTCLTILHSDSVDCESFYSDILNVKTTHYKNINYLLVPSGAYLQSKENMFIKTSTSNLSILNTVFMEKESFPLYLIQDGKSLFTLTYHNLEGFHIAGLYDSFISNKKDSLINSLQEDSISDMNILHNSPFQAVNNILNSFSQLYKNSKVIRHYTIGGVTIFIVSIIIIIITVLCCCYKKKISCGNCDCFRRRRPVLPPRGESLQLQPSAPAAPAAPPAEEPLL